MRGPFAPMPSARELRRMKKRDESRGIKPRSDRHEIINPVTEAVIRVRIESDIQRLRTDAGLQAFMGDDAARIASMAGSSFDSGDGMEVAEQEKAILADMARRLHARIAELEAQLEASGFTAADMATAEARGFRDGVASVAANAGSEPIAWLVCTEEGDPSMVFLDQREAQMFLEDDERPTPLYTHPPPTSAEGV